VSSTWYRKTKLVCTIGPATSSKEEFLKLVQAGEAHPQSLRAIAGGGGGGKQEQEREQARCHAVSSKEEFRKLVSKCTSCAAEARRASSSSSSSQCVGPLVTAIPYELIRLVRMERLSQKTGLTQVRTARVCWSTAAMNSGTDVEFWLCSVYHNHSCSGCVHSMSAAAVAAAAHSWPTPELLSVPDVLPALQA
jgi:hypothetical protein